MLVIGVGNEYRGDDAVGLAVSAKLAEMDLEGVTVITQSGEGTELLATLRGAEDVVLVDAVHGHGVVGQVHRIDPRQSQDWDRQSGFSTHGFGVGQAIRMAQAMNLLPARFVLFGIEGANFEPGRGLSPEVEAAAEEVVRSVKEEFSCTNKG